MSTFWANALGGAAPAAPPRPAQQNSGPWWNQPVLPPSAPADPSVVQTPHQPTATLPSKAQSARSTETCPECGSSNYFKPTGMPNYMAQCFECGGNARFGTQSGSVGLPSSDSGPATPARQVASAHQGYSGAVIGKA